MKPEELKDIVSEHPEGCRLKCYIQPRSSRNKLVGIHNNAIKIALTSPPVDGKANKALIQFMARLCGVSKSSVRIAAGESSRNKTIAITGGTPKEIIAKLCN